MQIPDQPKIRVVIRKRPLNKKQQAKSEQDVVDILNTTQVKVREHKLKVDLTKYIQEHSFHFDSAMHEQTNNQQMYQQCVKPIVQTAFLGAKVTCFAYGQTGSGKTYTMNGDVENGCPGMYYLGAEDIFSLRDSSYSNLKIHVSFYEIYCGKLFDLLNNRQQLQPREDGKQNVNIIGLTIKQINNIEEFMETIMYGSSVRITSQNSTNSDSSRSHAILQISLMNGKSNYGKISFIDLAGCERGADTLDQNKQTKIDGAEINKSLLALKQCIRALDQGKNHTPFRGSKLTMVLKDSFTGFCRTLMIGNISPSSGSCQNTLNTLRYADRVKQLKKPGSSGQLSREDQLAKELMLPRTQKNKQIIMKNESDSDEQIIINCNQLAKNKKKVEARPTTGVDKKKPKYLPQTKYEEYEEDVLFTKKKSQVTKNNRKGVLGNQQIHNENNNVKSVNHFGENQQKINRNKSVFGRDLKNDLGKSVKNNYQVPKKVTGGTQPVVSDRKSFLNNNSLLEKKGHLKLKDQFKSLRTEQSDRILETTDHKHWERIIQKFRNWKQNSNQFEEMSGYFQELVKLIMQQQLQISECHKNILKREELMLGQSLNLYNESQKQSKNNSQMLEYTDRVHGHFEGRIKAFSQLKVKIQRYQYHLKEHEMCQRKLMEAGQMIGNGSGLWSDNYEIKIPNMQY